MLNSPWAQFQPPIDLYVMERFLYFLFFFHHPLTNKLLFLLGVLIDWYFDQMGMGFWREFELDTKESKMSYVWIIECVSVRI